MIQETYITKYIDTYMDWKKVIKRSKYYSKKVVIDGIKFDSKKEGEYYQKLKILEKQGIIKDLELQKEYILQDKFKINGKTRRKITYRADFSYVSTEDDKLHVVDIKSSFTRKNEVYRIKKKLFEYKYEIELEEVIWWKYGKILKVMKVNIKWAI